MKIFYAVQATGNGHISRATQLYPYLKKYGEVDIFLSGNNSTLDFPFPVKYRSKGVSLYYSECGDLDHKKILCNVHLLSIYKTARSLSLNKYDIVINDFEFITALACKLQKTKSVHFGHQASFQSVNTPRPKHKNIIGEMVLKNYAKAQSYIGLHFDSYDDFIYPPVIKNEFVNKDPIHKDHITVYLPAFEEHCILNAFKKLPDIQFHWFLPNIKKITQDKNITYFPVNQALFNESLFSCHGLITGGGFETPSEALYLGKQLMSIPINRHYEQMCNAAALTKMGVKVLDRITSDFSEEIRTWHDNPIINNTVKANNIPETLQYLMDTY